MHRATALLLAVASTALAQEAYDGAVRREEKPQPPPQPQMTKAPQLLRSVEPVYPPAAAAAKLSGHVTMEIEIAADGTVAGAKVISSEIEGAAHGPGDGASAKPSETGTATGRSSAADGFDEAALAAVKQFVFSPAEVDGKTAPVRIQYTQHFVFKEPEKPAAPPPKPITFKGKILERGTRKPLAGAGVKINGTQAVAEADADGRFELALDPGPFDVEVVATGHDPSRSRETLRAGESLEVTYYLMPKQYGLYETVVRSDREKKEVTRRTLQREELEKVPGSFGDPIRVLQDLPGVARMPFGIGALLVRGASPNDTGTYLDGIQIPILYHFGGGPSVINPEFVDKIDFYPGGFGAEYGRAIGGIVDVGTRPVIDPQWHGSAKVDLIDSGAYLAVPLGDALSLSLGGRRSYVDLFLPLVLNAQSVRVSPVYFDYQLRLDFHPKGSRHALQLFGFGSDDLLKVVFAPGGNSNDIQINNHTGFQRLVAAWTYRGETFTNRLQLFAGKNENSFGLDLLRRDQDDNVLGVRERAELTLTPWLTARGGLDVSLTQSGVTLRAPPPPAAYRGFPGEAVSQEDPVTTVTNQDDFPYAEWLEAQLTFGGLKVFSSARIEQYRVSGQWRFAADPRLMLRQELGPADHRTTLKASIGLYHQAPDAAALLPGTGNPNLGLEAAFQTSAGVEQKITDTINVDVTGFYNRRFDLVSRTADTVTAGDGTIQRLNFDNSLLGRSYGVEVFLRRELTSNFFGWIAYTLSWSEQKPKNQGWGWTGFDQRHILTLVAQYKFGNGWELGGRFRLSTGIPTGVYDDSTFDADSNSYRAIGQAGAAREPTFHQLDLRVDRAFVFDLWTLGLYLDVQNVYNASNQELSFYDYRFRTQQVVPGLPILPTLGVKGTF
ncbi:MAG TPA: energy transducer TonB [Myxococcaceae bacterium]|nr:energy transducer TonB [Myxococcaceae bacterium]